MGLDAANNFVIIAPDEVEYDEGEAPPEEEATLAATPDRGTIVSVGPQANTDFEVGQTVFYDPDMARVLHDDDEEFVAVEDGDIFAIVQEPTLY